MNEDRSGRSERERLPDFLEQARSLPERERARFVESIQDAALRRELSALLAAATEADAFFDRFAAALDAARDDVAEEAMREPVPGESIGLYRIEERLGAGGMGVVFRAYDTRLERMVALKFRSVGLDATTWSRERFLTEARAAAALDHPNVCTIHEVGVTPDGASFIAMAFYPGETLEAVIRRGPLPPEVAVSCAIQIARGLAAAHERGITHRDVKPGNVMITADGVVKLLDFGIARTPGDSASPSGVTPGTIDYMSPEQVSGAPVDHRTDLWSLGVVLYEMCTGARPLRRKSRAATLHAIQHEQPSGASRLAPDTPPELERIIARLLEKDPSARHESASELVADLAQVFDRPVAAPATNAARGVPTRRRAALVTAGMVGLAVAGWMLAAVQPAQRSTILIADGVGDTASGSFLSGHLRRALASSSRLELADSAQIAAALRRMGRESDTRLTPEVAREIAMREGLEAYVHVTADRIGRSFAVGALLIETETGEPLDYYAATALNADGLAMAADRLAGAIRDRFGERLDELDAPAPRLAVTTDSMPALSKYLDAVQANRIGDFQKGIRLLDEAIAIDSGFADAYLTQAFALEQLGLRAGRAQEQIQSAWHLRPTLTAHERHTVEGDHAWHVQGDLDAAERSIRASHEEASRLVPGRVLNRRSHGQALVLNGRPAEAESVLREGARLAPCPVTKGILIGVLYTLNREVDARTILDEATRQWPTNPLLANDSAHFAAVSGRYRRAHELAYKAGLPSSKLFALRALAGFDAVEGRLAEAAEHLTELRAALLDDGLLAPAVEASASIARLRLVAGDTAEGVRRMRQFLAQHPLETLPPAERPYLSVALFFADAREPQDARALIDAYETLVPAEWKGPDRWMLQRVRAALFMANDQPQLALDALLEARSAARIWNEWFAPTLFEMSARPELARAYERVGQPDSAITVYERYIEARVLGRTEMDAFELARARSRLAALYEREGRPDLSALHRDALATLWQNADPELRTLSMPSAN